MLQVMVLYLLITEMSAIHLENLISAREMASKFAINSIENGKPSY